MRIIIISSILLLCFLKGNAQYSCLDPSRVPDPTFQCGDPLYEPVCGCDQITYRNACAAEMWGGILNTGNNWIDGVCGNFDFEIIPSMIKFLPVQLNMYAKVSGEATLYVYNRMGSLVATPEFFHVTGGLPFIRQLDYQSFELGIYFAQLVFNGEYQTKKIGKVGDQ